MKKKLAMHYVEYVVLLVFLIGMALLYDYPTVWKLGPYSFHMWRQTDCLALTQGYYENGLNFFQPRMNNLEGGTGKAVSEFPILYYINAVFWKIFGKSEMLYRVFTTILSFVGLFFIFKLTRKLLDSFFWALMVALFLFTSPIYVFYANNFLGNVPSLSFVFAGWYTFYLFYKQGNTRALAVSMFCITFASLLRLTMLYTYTFVYLAFVIEAFGWQRYGKDGQLLFKYRASQGIILAIPIAIIGLWTAYASFYNHINGTEDIFLMRIIPIWEIEWSRFVAIIDQWLSLWAKDIWLSIAGLILLGIVWIFAVSNLNKYQPILRLALLSLTIFLLFYLLLFFQNLHEHDYYLLEILPFAVFLLLAFLLLLKQRYSSLFQSIGLKNISVFILMLSTVYCTARYRIRYQCKGEPWVESLSFIYSKDYLEFLKWFHFDYDIKWKAFENIEPYLQKIGIGKEDIVITIPDSSPNVTLYMMNRKGYSSFNQSENLSNLIQKAKQNKVKYLIVNNPDTAKSIQEEKLVGAPMSKFENITIYDLGSLP